MYPARLEVTSLLVTSGHFRLALRTYNLSHIEVPLIQMHVLRVGGIILIRAPTVSFSINFNKSIEMYYKWIKHLGPFGLTGTCQGMIQSVWF